MARDPAAGPRPALSEMHPWLPILAGLAINLLAWLIGSAVPSGLDVVRLLLVLIGTVAALCGVMAQLRVAKWALGDRVESAAMIAAAGSAALFAWFGMNADWESGKMFFGALFILSLAGVFLVMLPPVGRRVFLSLFVLFHFGGMVAAITSVDPPGASAPWVSKQLLTRVYRPYLTFLHLTNAYHFFSPDPRPSPMLWFAVMYEDGSYSWVKMPERSDSALGIHYFRRLALADTTFGGSGRLPLNDAELAYLKDQADRAGEKFTYPERGSWEDIRKRRHLIGSTMQFEATIERTPGVKTKEAMPIPLVQDVFEANQYSEPHDLSKKWLSSLVKRILLTAPPSDSGAAVRSAKMYRVINQVMSPRELAAGADPMDKTKHTVSFVGEYDAEGKLIDPNEPFLYWYLPIAKVPENYPDGPGAGAEMPIIRVNSPPKKGFVLDCLEMHAAGELKKPAKKGDK